MPNKNPKRDEIERILKGHPNKKAFNIAKESGLSEDMGIEKAVDYIRGVRKAMRRQGKLPQVNTIVATDEERLADIMTLFEMRNGKMSKKAAATMLLLNCYYRFRSEDDNIHAAAIDSTYTINEQLNRPLSLIEAIGICDTALAQYMASIDEEKNAEAKRKGYPKAGLNYSDKTLIEICEITDEELQRLQSIRKE